MGVSGVRAVGAHGLAGVIASAAQCGAEGDHGGHVEDSQQCGIGVMTGEGQLVIVRW